MTVSAAINFSVCTVLNMYTKTIAAYEIEPKGCVLRVK